MAPEATIVGLRLENAKCLLGAGEVEAKALMQGEYLGRSLAGS